MSRRGARPGGVLGAATEARLRGMLEDWRRREGVPGVALVLVDRDGRTTSVLDGRADIERGVAVGEDHRFQVGSIGKSFTAIALLRLAERGRVDLASRVRRYLPWFRAGESTRRITLHHLLSHTAGLPAGPDLSDASAMDVWALRDLATMAPGRYWYSNAGYKALGLVLEAVAGEPYPELLEREVLAPLDLAGTRPAITHADRAVHAVGYEPEPDRYPPARAPRVPAPFVATSTADGSVVATATDLARYLGMLLQGGQWRGQTLLTPHSFSLLTGRHVRSAASSWYGYGLGTQVLDGRTVVGHGGDMLGFRTSLLGDLAAGLGVVALSNLRGARTAHVARDALRLAWADRGFAGWPATAATAPASALAERLVSADGTLALEPTGVEPTLRCDGRHVELLPRDQDAFEVADPELGRFLVRLGRDRTGRVVLATHGARVLRPDGDRNPVVAHRPSRARRYIGRFRSGNPWRRMFDVIEREGRLQLVEADGSESRLVRVGRNRFRDGVERNPERVVFDALVGGRYLRAIASGAAFHRSDAG